MKKIVNVLLLIVLTLTVCGQSKNELISSESILWLGIDFTEAHFEGKYDFGSPDELTGKYVTAWNQVLLQEPEKFNVGEYFGFEDVETDFGIALKRNENLDKEKIFLSAGEIRDYKLNEDIIRKIVSGYNAEYDGYALLFVVESYSKSAILANIWITFFHVPSKEVILTKKMSVEPSGFGVRNYWTGAVYKVMKEWEFN
ncbi:MAG: hypothetical protein JXB24_10140 [Bacteroidales bacterium]|nr:hypothetical protein [Bacteroidales bacterium]